MVYQWSDLLKLDGNPPKCALDRPKWSMAAMGKAEKQLSAQGTSMSRRILDELFGTYEKRRFIITVNRFPYDVARDVSHLVVWLNPLYDGSEAEVRKYLSGVVSKYVMYENPLGHRSVTIIPHFQLFVKRDDAKKIPLDKLNIGF